MKLELGRLPPKNVPMSLGVLRAEQGAGLTPATLGSSGFVDIWPRSLLPSPGWHSRRGGGGGRSACWQASREGGISHGVSSSLFSSQSRMTGSPNWRAMRDTRRYRHHYPVRSCLKHP